MRPPGAALLVVVLLVWSAAGWSLAGREAPAPAPAPLRSWEAGLSAALPQALAQAAPSLVRIRPAADREGLRARSAVVIAKELVITASSNVEVFGVGELVVEDARGRVLPARLRGRDLRLRLVLLRVPGLQAPPAPPTRRPLRAGSFLLALGTTLAPPPPGQRAPGKTPPGKTLRLPTATLGILSARARFQGRFDQVDAELDGSKVGGALVDLEGRLAGILIQLSPRLGERSGVAFSVPLELVRAALPELIAGKQLELGLLGLHVPKVASAAAGGVEVIAVSPQGPAAQAGVQRGDRILALQGRATPTLGAFRAASARLYAGQEVRVRLRRQGAIRELRLRVAARGQ